MRAPSAAFPLALLVALASSPAHARKLALTVFGTSGTTKSVEGTEWGQYLYSAGCMGQSGWDVQALVSGKTSLEAGEGDDTTEFETKLKGVIGAERVRRLPQAAQGQAALEAAIRSSTASLRAGDQFLLQINAHGHSNCEVRGAGADLQRGARDYEHCDHTFELTFGGKVFRASSAAVAAALAPLQARGVKAAVELKSCFGGAAIKDFADRGLCAHAYSSPDSLLSMCGGDDDSEADASGTADLTTHAACRHLSDDAFGALERRIAPAADRVACAAKTRAILRKLGLPNGVSASAAFDRMRAADRSKNQPVGSDGPYWVFGNLGVLGTAGMGYHGGQVVAPVQLGLASCPRTADDYFRGVTENIASVSRSMLGPACDLKSRLDSFMTAHRADLGAYFDAFTRVNNLRGQTRSLLLSRVPAQTRRALIDCEAQLIPPAMRDQVRRQMEEDPLDTVQSNVMTDQAPCHGVAASAMTADELSETRRQVTRILKVDAPAAYRDLESQHQAKVMSLERSLYDELKRSPEYAACVQAKPNLQAAKRACEGFEMP